MTNHFQLFLCTDETNLIQESIASGVDGVIVEWEEINNTTKSTLDKIRSLQKVRNCTQAWVICRLQPFHSQTREEVDRAISNGADEIWLPKVSSIQEVEKTLELVKDSCSLGIVMETLAAIAIKNQLAQLPIKRVHIGLNDLAESLENPHSFCSLVDGTIDRIVQDLYFPYGFGGLTLPDKGDPISAYLMMVELVRNQCSFSLLRNSFLKDIKGKSLNLEIQKIRTTLDEIRQLSREDIEVKHLQFKEKVLNLTNYKT